MTASEFWIRFPNYETTSSELVESALAEAARNLSADVYGTRFDDAQAYLAAHILWATPFGTTTRLDGDPEPEKRSHFWDRFAQIRSEVAPRMMVL